MTVVNLHACRVFPTTMESLILPSPEEYSYDFNASSFHSMARLKLNWGHAPDGYPWLSVCQNWFRRSGGTPRDLMDEAILFAEAIEATDLMIGTTFRVEHDPLTFVPTKILGYFGFVRPRRY